MNNSFPDNTADSVANEYLGLSFLALHGNLTASSVLHGTVTPFTSTPDINTTAYTNIINTALNNITGSNRKNVTIINNTNTTIIGKGWNATKVFSKELSYKIRVQLLVIRVDHDHIKSNLSVR